MLRSKAVPGTPWMAVVASMGVALGCQCIVASPWSTYSARHTGAASCPLGAAGLGCQCPAWEVGALSTLFPPPLLRAGVPRRELLPQGCFCKGLCRPHRPGNHIHRWHGSCSGKARTAKGRGRNRWKQREIFPDKSGSSNRSRGWRRVCICNQKG